MRTFSDTEVDTFRLTAGTTLGIKLVMLAPCITLIRSIKCTNVIQVCTKTNNVPQCNYYARRSRHADIGCSAGLVTGTAYHVYKPGLQQNILECAGTVETSYKPD